MPPSQKVSLGLDIPGEGEEGEEEEQGSTGRGSPLDPQGWAVLALPT